MDASPPRLVLDIPPDNLEEVRPHIGPQVADGRGGRLTSKDRRQPAPRSASREDNTPPRYHEPRRPQLPRGDQDANRQYRDHGQQQYRTDEPSRQVRESSSPMGRRPFNPDDTRPKTKGNITERLGHGTGKARIQKNKPRKEYTDSEVCRQNGILRRDVDELIHELEDTVPRREYDRVTAELRKCQAKLGRSTTEAEHRESSLQADIQILRADAEHLRKALEEHTRKQFSFGYSQAFVDSAASEQQQRVEEAHREKSRVLAALEQVKSECEQHRFAAECKTAEIDRLKGQLETALRRLEEQRAYKIQAEQDLKALQLRRSKHPRTHDYRGHPADEDSTSSSPEGPSSAVSSAAAHSARMQPSPADDSNSSHQAPPGAAFDAEIATTELFAQLQTNGNRSPASEFAFGLGP